MIPKSIAWLKIAAASAVGGAAGAILDFYHAGWQATEIDYHKMAQSAIVGALLAICHLLIPSPVGDKKP